ncbi:MAG: glycosyltransferase family 2 protein [bacterium]
MHKFFIIIFWLSIIFIFYTYFGYPILLIILAKLRSRNVDKKDITPSVSMIIAAYNEEKNIRNKLENVISLDYPKDKFEVIVVSDASTDQTDDIVLEFKAQNCDKILANPLPVLKLIRMPKRGGKASALNFAMSEAKGDIIVLSDTRQLYDRNAIRELASNFNDPSVGAVSGELYLENPEGVAVGEGVGMYWKYEKLMRKMESRLYSTSGATGAIYAIRKELFKPIPDDTILDDVVIPMNIVLSGYRVVFDESARAFDRVASTAKQELTRKIRTLCGNYQLMFRMPQLLNPFRNKVFFQTISHKFFRLFVPFALIFALISSTFLIKSTAYKIMLILQIIMYLSALVGHFLAKKPSFISRLFGIPYTFLVLNYAALAGLYRFITQKQSAAWERAS